mmetsp:Transcript_52683/g.59616  ORF Transcript_52683/g.59616 Transcript_52683/m.59616 type:complete len:219 (+) Transcript_52683:41-697(+)
MYIMNSKSYQEEDVSNKHAAAAAATEETTLKSTLKRWQTTPSKVAAIVLTILMYVVVVVSSPLSLQGIRGTGSGGGGGDASINYQPAPGNSPHAFNFNPLCPTTGSPITMTIGKTQTPGVVYAGLDYSATSYNHYRTDYYPIFNEVWQACAYWCHEDVRCRTFTVHMKELAGRGRYGDCYVHDHWLDKRGGAYYKKSLTDRNVVSGVCRPEDSWKGFK